MNIIADALFQNPITPVSLNVATKAQKRDKVEEKTTFNVD